MSSEIKEIQPAGQEVAVLNSLQSALEKGVDADSLEKILNMQERVLDRQAEQAYAQAMVSVQSTMPVIKKNRHNQQTRSEYADMEQILKQITPVYTHAGFCLSFGTADSPHAGHVRVTCDVMHSQGHSKPYFADIPLDVDGIKGNRNKTEVHGTGSAMSYGTRYLTIMIFNLNTGDDDDGNSAGGDTRSAKDIESEWIARMLILRELLPSILAIKENIALGELSAAAEAWGELTKEELNAVWYPSATKGGILTTQEHTIIKSDEWSQARNGINHD